MMKKVYRFHEQGVIPGIVGSFPAGSTVTIDLDTMTVLEIIPGFIGELQEEETLPASPLESLSSLPHESSSIESAPVQPFIEQE